MVLYKKTNVQEGSITIARVVVASLKLDVPKSKAFIGSRNAKEINSFLWSLECNT